MLGMLILTLIIDKNVIKVHKQKLFHDWYKHMCHHSHEQIGSI